MEALSFECPRCSAKVDERFYGPCTSCRGELSAGFSGDGRVVAHVAYEPKMNVVPNQIATKE